MVDNMKELLHEYLDLIVSCEALIWFFCILWFLDGNNSISLLDVSFSSVFVLGVGWLVEFWILGMIVGWLVGGVLNLKYNGHLLDN